MRLPTTVASPASPTSIRMALAPLADSGKAAWVRDTATTGAPALAKAVAIPWPRPRLAPTTIVVLLDRSLIWCPPSHGHASRRGGQFRRGTGQRHACLRQT